MRKGKQLEGYETGVNAIETAIASGFGRGGGGLLHDVRLMIPGQVRVAAARRVVREGGEVGVF